VVEVKTNEKELVFLSETKQIGFKMAIKLIEEKL
jgi:hypothetical protein